MDLDLMAISIPTGIPTRGVDGLVAEGATYDDLVAFGRTKEADYERLKFVHDNLLTAQTYAPLLIAAPDVTDEDLKRMLLEAGWVIAFDNGKFGTPEELQMWLNRFRRFRAAVIASMKA